MSKSATEKAVEEAVRVAGSLRNVADQLGVSSQAISQWTRWQKVPPKRVLALEAISGVSRHDLRPDIYGPPPDQKRVRPSQRAVARAA
jgi:DNA-binding transcriptional regulator YdaS (Cro superfamily)